MDEIKRLKITIKILIVLMIMVTSLYVIAGVSMIVTLNNKNVEIERLNNHVQFVVDKHNKINHENHELKSIIGRFQ